MFYQNKSNLFTDLNPQKLITFFELDEFIGSIELCRENLRPHSKQSESQFSLTLKNTKKNRNKNSEHLFGSVNMEISLRVR